MYGHLNVKIKECILQFSLKTQRAVLRYKPADQANSHSCCSLLVYNDAIFGSGRWVLAIRMNPRPLSYPRVGDGTFFQDTDCRKINLTAFEM